MLLVAALLMLGACGSDDTGGPGAVTTAPAEPTEAGCNAQVLGDVTAAFASGGGARNVNSDYWFTEAELVEAAKARNVDEATVKANLAAQKFVLDPLTLKCGDSRTGVTFLAKAQSFSEFALGPKTYPVAAGNGTTAKNGEVGASVLVDKAPYVVKSGSFEVKKFDKSGISGGFNLVIEEATPVAGSPAKKAALTGTFEVVCTGSAAKGGCAR